MTYKELSKELGISSSKLMSLENEGLLHIKGPAALLGNFGDEDVRIIRLCCLFSMLGLSGDEISSIINDGADLRGVLKRQVDRILSDESNHSQAAIVLQNIRRECNRIDELDPVIYLQHIKELKHSGGLFYDVNTGRLEEAKRTQDSQDPGKKKFSKFFALFSTRYMDEFEEELEEEKRREEEAQKRMTSKRTDAEQKTEYRAEEHRGEEGRNEKVRGAEGRTEGTQVVEGRTEGTQVVEGRTGGAWVAEGSAEDAQVSEGSTEGKPVAEGSTEEIQVSEGSTEGAQVSENRTEGTRVAEGSTVGARVAEGWMGENRKTEGVWEAGGRTKDIGETEGRTGEVRKTEDDSGYLGESGKDTDESRYKQKELYDSTETGTNKSAGYDDNWSPYINRGFGASNMGTGNWQGWTPGYGSYSGKIGTRERINNGEKTCPHPVRRFAARAIDTTVVSLIGGAVARLGFRLNLGNSLTMVAYAEILFWFFEMIIEPLLLSTAGTTLGKWIMGISVRDMKTGNKLDLKQAYIRSLKLAWYGFGFMIPVFTIFRRIVSFARCKIDDTMLWDNGINIELKDQSAVRIVLVILSLILLNVCDEIVAKQALIPPNSGELTENQFYENVIDIMKYTEYPGDIPPFIVEVRSGYVKSVKLEYTEDQVDRDRYNEMLIGFLAFAGAADGSNGLTLMLSSSTGLIKTYYNSFQDTYCGISLNNISDSTVGDPASYSMLFSLLYGTDVSIPSFNQTFTMSK